MSVKKIDTRNLHVSAKLFITHIRNPDSLEHWKMFPPVINSENYNSTFIVPYEFAT